MASKKINPRSIKTLGRQFDNSNLIGLLEEISEKMIEKKNPWNSHSVNEYYFILTGIPHFLELKGYEAHTLKDLKEIEKGIFYKKILEGIKYIRKDLRSSI